MIRIAWFFRNSQFSREGLLQQLSYLTVTVIDASLAVAYLLHEEGWEDAESVLRQESMPLATFDGPQLEAAKRLGIRSTKKA